MNGMVKSAVLASMAVSLAAWADADAGSEPGSAEAESTTAEVAAGATVSVNLACSPTTGYDWEVKSINRKIAAPVGPVEFQGEPGRLGGGGTCVLKLKGVKPGKTDAVLEYRRPGDKGPPAKTFTAHVAVRPAK